MRGEEDHGEPGDLLRVAREGAHAQRRGDAEAVAQGVARATVGQRELDRRDVGDPVLQRRHVAARRARWRRRRERRGEREAPRTTGSSEASAPAGSARRSTPRRRVVRRAEHDRLAGGEGVDRRHGARDGDVEQQLGGKLLAHVRGDALRHLVALLEHREQDAVEHERRVARRRPRARRAGSASSSGARAARTGAAPARAGCARARGASRRPGPAACPRRRCSRARAPDRTARRAAATRRAARHRSRARPPRSPSRRAARAARAAASPARRPAARACRSADRPGRRCRRRRTSPMPWRTAPCGSTSTSSVLRPRCASALARLIAVVVFPTPPFWLTTARTVPTTTRAARGAWPPGARSSSSVCRACRTQRSASLPVGGVSRKASRCARRLRVVAALEVQEREPVVRARRAPGRARARAGSALTASFEPPGAREGDRHVLEDARIAAGGRAAPDGTT